MSTSTEMMSKEQLERRNLLPEWQNQLISQISYALSRYYCLPKKLQESEFLSHLHEDFIKLNQSQFPQFMEHDHMPSPAQKQQFIAELNKILTTFDPHLELQYTPDFIEKCAKNGQIKGGRFDFGQMPREVLREMNEYRGHPDRNYGFKDTPPSGSPTIPDDIGYLKIDFFLNPQDGIDESDPAYRLGPNAVETLNKIMRSMQGKKGIVLDLRDVKEGGSPEMVQYLVSFFIKQKGMLINEIEDYLTGTNSSYKVIETACGLYDMPVRILIDGSTFSACEELPYDLQQLNSELRFNGKQDGNRFQVIGTPSRGGAHPEFAFPLIDPIGNLNKDTVIRIPYATTVNPYTHSNWEDGQKKGVQPDIEISRYQNALDVAIESIKQAHLPSSTYRSSAAFARTVQSPVFSAGSQASSPLGPQDNISEKDSTTNEIFKGPPQKK